MKRLVDFSKYSSIKIGTPIEVDIIEDEIALLDGAFIIGGANNLLVSNNPPPLYMLSKKFSYITLKKDILKIGGATKSGVINSFCKKHNIKGLEFLAKLPGTLGGLVAMNAGMKDDEIFNYLLEVKTDKGYIKKEDISHGYRYADIDGVVYEAVFKVEFGYSLNRVELFDKMRKNQPKEPSAGSVFKNPKGDFAGRLIEAVGLKGVKRGDVGFSEVHANFLVNYGGGVYKDAIYLIELAKKRVFEEFGILLEEEIIIL